MSSIPPLGSILEGVAGQLPALSHGTAVGRIWPVLFCPLCGKSLGSGLAAGIDKRPESPSSGGCAGDKGGSQQEHGGPWQWRNETQPDLTAVILQELLLVVPCLFNQLLLKHQQAEQGSQTTISPHKATQSRETEPRGGRREDPGPHHAPGARS